MVVAHSFPSYAPGDGWDHCGQNPVYYSCWELTVGEMILVLNYRENNHNVCLSIHNMQ